MRAERRRAREAAMRALYQMDLSGCSIDRAIEYSVMDSPDLDLSARSMDYARELALGVASDLPRIDVTIANLARDWSLDRMSPTDRNIMRVAVYEMLNVKEVPVAAAIDEAVEIAKTYGSADSPRFINGILGSLAEQLKAKPSESKGSDESGDDGEEDGEPRA